MEEPMDTGESDNVSSKDFERWYEGEVKNDERSLQKDSLTVVFDTCVLIESPRIIFECVNASHYAVIPYKVVEELDHLKKLDDDSKQSSASEANALLYDLTQLNNNFIIFESSFESSERLDGFSCHNSDDYILKCALQYSMKYSASVKVVLATEDKNLSIKAAANHVVALTIKQLTDIIEPDQNDNNETLSDFEEQQTDANETNFNGDHRCVHQFSTPRQSKTAVDCEEMNKSAVNKSLSTLESFSFVFDRSPSTSAALKVLDDAAKKAPSVFERRRRCDEEPKMSEEMRRFLGYCEQVVGTMRMLRRGKDNKRIIRKDNNRFETNNDRSSVYQQDVRMLLDSIHAVQAHRVGSVRRLLDQIEHLTHLYFGKQVSFNKSDLEKEYPLVWRQVNRRLTHLQTCLW